MLQQRLDSAVHLIFVNMSAIHNLFAIIVIGRIRNDNALSQSTVGHHSFSIATSMKRMQSVSAHKAETCAGQMLRLDSNRHIIEFSVISVRQIKCNPIPLAVGVNQSRQMK